MTQCLTHLSSPSPGRRTWPSLNSSGVDHCVLEVNQTYRITMLRSITSRRSRANEESTQPQSENPTASQHLEPPVDEGEIREVTIESVGDQGDGIAKVERGFVVIVPDALLGDKPTVEVEQVREVAMRKTTVASLLEPKNCHAVATRSRSSTSRSMSVRGPRGYARSMIPCLLARMMSP